MTPFQRRYDVVSTLKRHRVLRGNVEKPVKNYRLRKLQKQMQLNLQTF